MSLHAIAAISLPVDERQYHKVFLYVDQTGGEKNVMCQSLGSTWRTWEPEDLWEYVWLGTLMDDGKYIHHSQRVRMSKRKRQTQSVNIFGPHWTVGWSVGELF